MKQTPTTDSITLQALFDALRHPERRQVLVRLNDFPPATDDAVELEAVFRDDYLDDAAVSLHHVHLPKLDAAGFVDWDPDRRVISHGRRFDAIAPLIDLLEDHHHDLPVEWP